MPLVPAGISGTDGLSRLAKLRVVFGDAIELDDLAGMPIEDAAHVATERLSAVIGELEASFP